MSPTVAIIKHANPCGVASAASLAAAWELALRCDPVSAFGGIVAVNRTLDGATAEKIAAIFTEVIIAPDADAAARTVLSRKKNLRLLLTGGLPDPAAPGLTFRSVSGGFLAQTRDAGRIGAGDVSKTTSQAPAPTPRPVLLRAGACSTTCWIGCVAGTPRLTSEMARREAAGCTLPVLSP